MVGSYIRIRVLLDVCKSLKKTTKVKKRGGEANEFVIKYEKLGPFYFLCGGHVDELYDHLFSMAVDDGYKYWSIDFRADMWATTIENLAAKYLRGGGAASRSRSEKVNSNQCNNVNEPQPMNVSSDEESKHEKLMMDIYSNLKLISQQL